MESYSHLYVDFNSVIHGCARSLEYSEATKHDFESRVVKSCIEHVDHLIRTIRPSSLVYLAIDGKPPRGKMHQQRCRRFMSAASRSETEWDTNAVTPGTKFMTYLSETLRNEAKARNDERGGATWIVSGSDETGEGEQKIFQHARSSLGTAGERVALYGLDADLMLMAISFLRKNIAITS